ncbi:hypothetical protein PVA44_03810 [Entomospira nematocerorum]|uniref:Uncharacterized protein n=1 Tax=Entomospira nematocerorum TaxID=2719987 RepID=A0A968GD27_9SPIO|nr:hypothetical protein [Entomospira nematocera]NIZ46842.1 hypothetical protein [Entomospira nematocera]WDI33359.1 hypothetical protein PVA44_03810 [Entomospira nematocera]
MSGSIKIIVMLLSSIFFVACEQYIPAVLLEKEASVAIIKQGEHISYGLFIRLVYLDSSAQIVPDSLAIENSQRELVWDINTGIRRNYDGTLHVNTMLLANSYDDLYGDFLITWNEPMGRKNTEPMMLEKQYIPNLHNINLDTLEFQYLSTNNVHIEYMMLEESNIMLIRVLD